MARQQTVVVIITGNPSGPTSAPLSGEGMNEPDAEILIRTKDGSYTVEQAEAAACAARDILLGA